jgi:hypothetical protein
MNSVYPKGARNILQLLLAYIFKGEVELSRGISPYPRRYANSPRVSQAFKPSRDVHSIPENIFAFDNNIPLMDTDPELNLAIGWYDDVPLRHCRLNLSSAAQGIDNAAELDQHAIASRLDDAPAMLGYFGVDQFAPMRLQPRESSFLIGTHQSAVARHVSSENGG